MSGEKDLNILLRSLTPELAEGVFVFATLPNRALPKSIQPLMVFEEAEGTTIILKQSEADANGLAYEFPCRMITLNVHSSLEAVGMIAEVAAELSKHEISTNPVSGFFHDHLFVPDGREAEALEVLKRTSQV